MKTGNVNHLLMVAETHSSQVTRGVEKKKPAASQEVFLLAMFFYVSQLHEAVMDSWSRFRETQKVIRERRELQDRSREVHHRQEEVSRLEGEWRQEDLNGHQRHFHERGSCFYIGFNFQHPHLNLPV